MDLAWQLERDSWAAAQAGEAAAFFAKVMTDEAFVVLPGGVLGRDDLAGYLTDMASGRRVELGEPRLMLLDGETVMVSYRVEADGDDVPGYPACVTSMYAWADGGWALAFRQHTPDAWTG